MLLNAENLLRKYTRGQKEIKAVDGISLSVDNGEFVIIKGQSGSGKSTLLSMLAGLLCPTSGKVEFKGENLYTLSDKALSVLRNSSIGYIPQGHNLLSDLTVYENILLPYRLYNSKNNNISEKINKLLQDFHISELKNSYPSDLSGGERKRVSIARALINDPDILLADEPTSDLDRINTVSILNSFSDISKNGTAVVMITHEDNIPYYKSTVLELENGKIK